MDKIIGLLVVGALVFFGYHYFNQPGSKTVVSTDTVEVVTTDTLIVRDTTEVTRFKAKLDTVTVTSKDTVYEGVQVAKADTLIQKDSTRLKIEYFFPPLNYFDIEWGTNKSEIEKVRTITEIQTVREPLLKNEWFWVAVGEGVVILAIVYKTISSLL